MSWTAEPHRRLAELLRLWRPVAVYPSTLIALALTTATVISAHVRHGETLTWSGRTMVALALSIVPSLCLFHLLHLALGHRRVALVMAELGLLVLYALLALEHFSLRAAPELMMIAPAPMAFVRRELHWLLGSPFCRVGLLAIAGGLVIVISQELLWRALSRWRLPAARRPRMIAAAGVYAAVVLLPWQNHDEVASFIRSALRHFSESSSSRLAAAGLDVRAPYPYVRSGDAASPSFDRPHVFIVAMESFDAGFVESRTKDGRPVTPTLDRLLRQGLYVEHFYANSVQTARGHLAILCSVLPSLWRKLAVAYPELELHCLPRILAAHGYRTTFFAGQDDLDYDDTRTTMHRLGFQDIRTVDGEPDGDRWGWGWEDDRLYRELFAALDGQPPGTRNFVFVPTISHHYAFDGAPPRERRLYPRPRSFREHFMNSINMADRYLARFFDELARRPGLRDSVVVLVGDHGFPTVGRNGREPHNEIGATDEVFRVPLVVLWPGRLRPSRIGRATYSQLDIAPTLLDLLRLSGPHHFVGRSLLRPPDPMRAVPLVQPFDGLYLGAVRWPFKYLRRQCSGEEWLFDLSRDPGEQDDLAAGSEREAELARLRRELPVIFFNQALLDSNRIWPRLQMIR